jgi:hypothetical protein
MNSQTPRAGSRLYYMLLSGHARIRALLVELKNIHPLSAVSDLCLAPETRRVKHTTQNNVVMRRNYILHQRTQVSCTRDLTVYICADTKSLDTRHALSRGNLARHA